MGQVWAAEQFRKKAPIMCIPEGPRQAVDHQHILDATIAELLVSGADEVTLTAVAQRAGVDVQDIRNLWPNKPELLNAALTSYSGQNIPTPDTGSLRGDLLAYAQMFAGAINSPMGRRLVGAVVATPRAWDTSGWRDSLFESHQSRVEPMLTRAVQSGACAADTDAARVMDLLNAALCLPIQLYDRPRDRGGYR